MSGLTVQEVVNKLPHFDTTLAYSNASERHEAMKTAATLAASVWSSFLNPEMCTVDQRKKLSGMSVKMSISTLPQSLPSYDDQQAFYQLLMEHVRDNLRQVQPYFGEDEYYSLVSLTTDYYPTDKLRDIWELANFPQSEEWGNSLLPCKSYVNIKLVDCHDSGTITVSASFMAPLF